MEALKRSILHMIPLVIFSLVILGVMYAAGNTEEIRQALLPMLFLVLGSGAEKFARTSEYLPLPDYVNDK